MAKCKDCALLAWRPGCTAGGGDDFNTYISDDDSDCPSFRPARSRPKPLEDELAEALRATTELCNRADDADIGPDCCADYDDVMKRNVAVLLRYEKEQADAEVR